MCNSDRVVLHETIILPTKVNLNPPPPTAEQSIKEWVYQSLRHALMCGQIDPGLPLTIRGLAETLDVSPMPVREALYRLSCEQAVEVKDNRRVIVPQMTAAKLQALFEMRIVLETHAACDALPYVRAEDILVLKQLDTAVDEAVACGDIERVTLTNQAFHRYLYAVPPAQVVVPMIESVWLQLGPFVRVVLSKLEAVYRVDRHQEAIEALRRHNAFALQRAIEADIRDGMAALEAIDGLDGLFE